MNEEDSAIIKKSNTSQKDRNTRSFVRKKGARNLFMQSPILPQKSSNRQGQDYSGISNSKLPGNKNIPTNSTPTSQDPSVSIQNHDNGALLERFENIQKGKSDVITCVISEVNGSKLQLVMTIPLSLSTHLDSPTLTADSVNINNDDNLHSVDSMPNQVGDSKQLQIEFDFDVLNDDFGVTLSSEYLDDYYLIS